jgi:ethanolamine utilization protein EutA (predicted chaperonin)
MNDVLLLVNLDVNDGAMRSALFDRGWLSPESATSLQRKLIETEAALGEMDASPAETQRLLDYALKVIDRQSETIEKLLKALP